MPKLNPCLLAAFGSLLLATLAHAQDTNAPRTRLEAFEDQADILIVRGAALLGEVHAGAGLVSGTGLAGDESSRLRVDPVSGGEKDGASLGRSKRGRGSGFSAAAAGGSTVTRGARAMGAGVD